MKKFNKIILILLLITVVTTSLSVVSAADIDNGTGISNDNNINYAQASVEPQNNTNNVNNAENINLLSDEGNNTGNNTNITPETNNTKEFNVTVEDFGQIYKNPKNLTINLTNFTNGKVIVGQHIALNLTRLSDGASKIYWATTDTNGQAFLDINLFPGYYSVNASCGDGSNFKNFTVYKIPSGVIQNNFEVNHKGESFRSILYNLYFQVLGNQKVYYTLSNGNSNKTYTTTTDSNGYARLPINLGAGKYTITFSYNGDGITSGCSETNNITIYPSSHKMPTTVGISGVQNNTFNITKGKNLTITVQENNGLLFPNTKVTVKIIKGSLSKTYTITTNSNGVGTLPINLGAGDYTVKCSYAGSYYYAASSSSTVLTVNNA
ncbi:MAG: carboxypeptidase-like regulatory domain-containing protein [Methanobacteriaceae archaeon]|nr:carboxypeptidase-like regulatory domain-containing protein [Methanobacteriaceae archaeon]